MKYATLFFAGILFLAFETSVFAFTPRSIKTELCGEVISLEVLGNETTNIKIKEDGRIREINGGSADMRKIKIGDSVHMRVSTDGTNYRLMQKDEWRCFCDNKENCAPVVMIRKEKTQHISNKKMRGGRT